MEPELTDEQLEFFGIQWSESGAYWLHEYKFGGSEEIFFYCGRPSLSEVLEEIYKAGKKDGAAEKVEEIKSKL